MQATLAVTADIATLTLHDALPISGTEFTTGASQLKNGDTIDSVTLTSTGAAATAHRSSGDLAVGLFGITASAAVAHTGTELTDYSDSYTAPSRTEERRVGNALITRNVTKRDIKSKNV